MSDPLIGRTIHDRYTITRAIGEGGMARVYQASQVAVTRFFREARAAAHLRHTNTIRVFDAGHAPDGTLYMAMELLHGQTVASVIKREGRLQTNRAIRIGVQICMSLAEAHEQGLVHRDLKPENIFLTGEIGRRDLVKVLDFGIVKLMEDPELLHLTTTGSTPGTPYYMSPEAGMSKPVSPRSDLYSLGVILFEMLTGKRPFEATNPVQVVVQHLTEPAPFMNAIAPEAGIPERLEAIVARLLSKEPGERYPTAYDVAEVLLASASKSDGLFGLKDALGPRRPSKATLGEAPTAEAMTAVDNAALTAPVPTDPDASRTQVTGGPAKTSPSSKKKTNPKKKKKATRTKTATKPLGDHPRRPTSRAGARKASARRRRPKDTLEAYPAFEGPEAES